MSELSNRLEDAVAAYEPAGWDPSETERQLVRLGTARRRQHVRRGALATAALALCVGVGMSWASTETANHVADKTEPGQPGLQFADGSFAMPIGDDSDVVVDTMTDDRVRLRLERGSGYFQVADDAERRFVVLSGRTYVLGEAFRLERIGAQTTVDVIRGVAEVRWETPDGDHRVRLRAGESGVFPPESSDGSAGERRGPDARGSRRGGRVGRRVRGGTDDVGDADDANAGGEGGLDWQGLARRGAFDEAYEALRRAAAPAGPEELMLAADAARRSGHSRAALPYLERVYRDHTGDARAPLAAFTAGRLLLRSDPSAAARMFARVRSLGGSPRMVQDAMAREVEAAARAGDSNRARRVGRAYLGRYPNGRRAAAVRRWAELE